MTIEKTKLGLPFFDNAVGGIYFNLPTLVRGRRACGKTVLAAQFVNKVLRTGEKVLVFCERPPETALLDARAAGLDFESPIRSRQLNIIPLSGIIKSSPDGRFPFDAAIEELHALVSRSSTSFVVFSSVAPWLEVHPVSDIQRRVKAFLDTLNALSLTSILLLHKPASAAAESLASTLVENCPIVLEMDAFRYTQRELRIVKYEGEKDLRLPIAIPLELISGKGLCPPGAADKPAPDPEPAEEPSGPALATPHSPRHRRALFAAAPTVSPIAQPGTTGGLPTPAATPGSAGAQPAPHPGSARRRRQTLFSSAPANLPAPTPPPPPPTSPSPASFAPTSPAPTSPSPTSPAPTTPARTRFAAAIPPTPPSAPTSPAPTSPAAPDPSAPPPPDPSPSGSRIRFSNVVR